MAQRADATKLVGYSLITKVKESSTLILYLFAFAKGDGAL